VRTPLTKAVSLLFYVSGQKAARRCAWRRRRWGAPRRPWAAITAGCEPAKAPRRRSRPPPISWRVCSIMCSNIARLINRRVRNSMNTTSVNGLFVTSSAPRRDWASPSSPSRSLPEILFLSSKAKQSLPAEKIALSPTAPRNDTYPSVFGHALSVVQFQPGPGPVHRHQLP
jgi:hypothetical protein